MPKRPARDLTIGVIFALALVIVALAIMAVGGESNPFSDRSRFYAVFPDATGLLVGAPVRMAGVQVGTVTGVRLPIDPTAPGIVVELGVESDYASRVREDSRATLRILQFLTNEKYVLVEPGSPDAKALSPGDTIPRLVEVGVVERGEAIADDLGEVTLALKEILGTMQRGEGMIGRMLTDPDFGTEGLDSLGGTLENLNKLTADLAEGKGTMGRMLYDEELAGKLDTLGTTIEDFSRVVQALANREGAIGQLLESGGSAEQALVDLAEAAGSLKRLTAGLETEQGILGRLLNDPVYSERLASDLEATLSDLREVAGKVNRGEGTLGALVNERDVYDGAEDIMVGMNDSKFARWLTRHYRKKGIKAQQEQAGSAAEAAPQPGEDP